VTYYQSEKAEFGTAYGERSYEDRIKAAYPFHPELFDLLYEFWSTVERFQRTRGVLRLMALVVATLWQVGDRSPLILPSSVPLDDPAVRSELLGYLEDAWDSIVGTDIDGADSIAARIDREAPNLGKYFAAEKVARTIFLGSAPMVRAPHRGLTQQRIRVGCALPGERPAVYNDALGRLARQANYLYAEEDRYWFGLSPSVGRLAQDRAAQYLQSRMDHIDGQICEHLRAKRNRGEFAGIHVTADPEDIPDDDRLRLVVLPPSHPHTVKAESSDAIDAARRILEIRSGGPRRYRNMLVFLAPDHGRLDDLRQRFADLLAWQSINEEREKLNLTAQEVRQAGERLDQARRACEQQLAQTYRFVLVPTQEATGPIQFTTLTLDGADASGEAVWRRLVNRGYASASYAPALLRRIVLEGPLQPEWEAGHISFRILWDAFASYVYLPRLASREVLAACAQRGPEGTAWEQEGFALADGYDEAAGRYLGLVCGPQSAVKPITPDTLLVNPSRATAQRDADAAAVSATLTQPSAVEITTAATGGSPDSGGTVSSPAKPRRFYGSVILHSDRLAREFGAVQQEVLSHLADAGAAVEVTLEISATAANGFDSKIVQIVSENANALRFRSHGFETE
ncbi:MAG: ATP-binding protein, partial [Acidothermus cellulolyticus]|nr:ATP-binding protein [Acidothermus cellulolyticus]